MLAKLGGLGAIVGSGYGADDDDIDGVPILPSTSAPPPPPPTKRDPSPDKKRPLPGFKPSKWETVDPEAVVEQAMTTSKWDLLEGGEDLSSSGSSTRPSSGAKFGLVAYDDDLDGTPMDTTPAESRSNSPPAQE
jgi:hypothetical protein